MNEDLYGLQASGIDPEIAAQMLQLKRKRSIAEAMQQQAMSPIQQQQTPNGGYAVRTSPLEVVAKLVQAYMGSKGLESADKQQATLASDNQRKVADAMSGYERMRSGAPEMAPTTPVDDNGNPNPPVAATKGDPMAALRTAMGNPLIANSPVLKMDMQRSNPVNLGPDHTLMNPLTGETIATGPKTMPPPKEVPKTELQKLQEYSSSLPIGSNERLQVQDAIRKLTVIPKELGTTIVHQPSPTMSEVIDPKNPTQMIRVDAKTYKGGSVGDVGVLGVSGKEPTAQKKSETVDTGQQTVNTIVDELRGHYKTLKDSGGIVNPESNSGTNIAARVRSSALGQLVGGAVGTEEQSARNSIAQTRPLLLNAIKNATGMSAKQMDSNAELKMYLAAATDPKLDIKSNEAALNNLVKLYGIGSGPKRRESDKGAVIDFNSLPK